MSYRDYRISFGLTDLKLRLPKIITVSKIEFGGLIRHSRTQRRIQAVWILGYYNLTRLCSVDIFLARIVTVIWRTQSSFEPFWLYSSTIGESRFLKTISIFPCLIYLSIRSWSLDNYVFFRFPLECFSPIFLTHAARTVSEEFSCIWSFTSLNRFK